jgi:hypothetical protein
MPQALAAMSLTSSASTIASTMQQMSVSFGVAPASLAAAFFVPDRFRTSPAEMVPGDPSGVPGPGGADHPLRAGVSRAPERVTAMRSASTMLSSTMGDVPGPGREVLTALL